MYRYKQKLTIVTIKIALNARLEAIQIGLDAINKYAIQLAAATVVVVTTEGSILQI